MRFAKGARNWTLSLWDKAAELAPLQRLSGALNWLADLGTDRYPDEIARRLKILNLIAYLIAITTLIYGLQHLFMDYEQFAPLVWVNLALVGLAVVVPWSHQFSPVLGGVIVVASEWTALTLITSMIGSDSGVHVQFLVGCAAPFVVFGLERVRLVLATVISGIGLHIFCWFAFPEPTLPATPEMQNAVYTQAAITTGVLLAASVWYAFSLAEAAKAETEQLLRNILPDAIVERLKRQPDEIVADEHANTAVLFADISGFVALAKQLGPENVVRLLNELVRAFDALADRHGVEKIKTIGDAYMAVAGVPEAVPDPTARLARFALAMLEEVERIKLRNGIELSMRVGMARGPLMAGVIGTKKFSYDVWGDTVNLAARLESASTKGQILVCPDCRNELISEFALETRGTIPIKGVGEREVFVIVGRTS